MENMITDILFLEERITAFFSCFCKISAFQIESQKEAIV